MGLLTIIRKQKLRENSLRILILGLDNAGKTTILKCLLGEDITQISPTLGFSIKTLIFQGFKLDIWDVGGQRSLRSYWRNYFESTDGVIWVVDSSDVQRLQDCKVELHKLLQEERLMGASLLVMANKTDIRGSLQPEEIQRHLQLDDIQNRQWDLMQVSAVTGRNIKEGFELIVHQASKRVL